MFQVPPTQSIVNRKCIKNHIYRKTVYVICCESSLIKIKFHVMEDSGGAERGKIINWQPICNKKIEEQKSLNASYI